MRRINTFVRLLSILLPLIVGKYNWIMSFCIVCDGRLDSLIIILVTIFFQMYQCFLLSVWYEFLIRLNLSWTLVSSLMLSCTYFFICDLTICSTWYRRWLKISTLIIHHLDELFSLRRWCQIIRQRIEVLLRLFLFLFCKNPLMYVYELTIIYCL